MLFPSLISEILYYAAVVSSAYFVGWWYFRAKRDDFLNAIHEVNVTVICQFNNQLDLIYQNNNWGILAQKLGFKQATRADQFREFLNYLARTTHMVRQNLPKHLQLSPVVKQIASLQEYHFLLMIKYAYSGQELPIQNITKIALFFS